LAREPLDLAADARYAATGKRKSAVARVVLRPGEGGYTINGLMKGPMGQFVETLSLREIRSFQEGTRFLGGITMEHRPTAALTHHASVRVPHERDGLLVILAIGSDIGPPHRPGDPLRGRADGVHIIAVDTQAKRATIVNIPRDSLIGGTKVLAHLASGGPERLQSVMESYTGIPIDYWAVMTFRSIENVVDGMGGVDMVIEQRMQDVWSGVNLQAGPQTVPGWQALAFTRARKSIPGGDFARTRNHGNLMRAAHAQIHARQSDLPTLTRLVALFARNTVTNIPRDQLLPRALLAVEIDPADVLHVPLGGSVGVGAGGASIVHLAAGDAFNRIRAGQVGP
jgi:LCP family protein required for cell wall assembly